jgi:hypothetical protein
VAAEPPPWGGGVADATSGVARRPPRPLGVAARFGVARKATPRARVGGSRAATPGTRGGAASLGAEVARRPPP